MSMIIKCPKCDESYYMEKYTTVTTVYYSPIYKNGININPNQNTYTHVCQCMNCHNEFTYQTKGEKIIND